jgi:hypothetical protein
MYKILISLVLLICGFIVLQPAAEAHLGGGPPFLKINDKNVTTNPYNQGASVFTIPWDVSPENYLVNKPITFAIDVEELLKATTAPSEVANEIKIRWSVAHGDNFTSKESTYDEGNAITKTFTSAGSYLIIVEAKLPAGADFAIIDTVQVNILPHEVYKLPVASVYVGTQLEDLKKDVLLVSNSSPYTSGSIQKYLWDFGEGNMQEGRSITRWFEKADTIGVEQVFHRVIDENGFVADIAFVAENKSDKLQFTSFNGKKNALLTIGTYEQAAHRAGKTDNKLTMLQFIVVGFGTLVVLGGILWVFIQSQLPKTNKN